MSLINRRLLRKYFPTISRWIALGLLTWIVPILVVGIMVGAISKADKYLKVLRAEETKGAESLEAARRIKAEIKVIVAEKKEVRALELPDIGDHFYQRFFIVIPQEWVAKICDRDKCDAVIIADDSPLVQVGARLFAMAASKEIHVAKVTELADINVKIGSKYRNYTLQGIYKRLGLLKWEEKGFSTDVFLVGILGERPAVDRIGSLEVLDIEPDNRNPKMGFLHIKEKVQLPGTLENCMVTGEELWDKENEVGIGEGFLSGTLSCPRGSDTIPALAIKSVTDLNSDGTFEIVSAYSRNFNLYLFDGKKFVREPGYPAKRKELFIHIGH